jgi:hypothetical protein
MSLVVVNATGPTTTTLPLISSLPGRTITIKDSGSASGTNIVTIQTTAGNTFETGVASYILNTPLAFITFLGNPTTLKWRVIATTYADVPITISTVTQATGTLGGAAGTLTTLSVSGLTTLGNSSNTGNLGVAGTTTLNSVSATNINFTGTLSSNGTTFSGAPAGINSAGSVGIGAAAGATTLLVTGTQSNTGTLGVAGAATITGIATVGSNVFLSNTSRSTQLTLVTGIGTAGTYASQALVGDSVIRVESGGLCLAPGYVGGFNNGLRIDPSGNTTFGGNVNISGNQLDIAANGNTCNDIRIGLRHHDNPAVQNERQFINANATMNEISISAGVYNSGANWIPYNTAATPLVSFISCRKGKVNFFTGVMSGTTADTAVVPTAIVDTGGISGGIYSRSFTTSTNINDTVNYAPSYGMGVTSNFAGLGPYSGSNQQPLQIAHYYGINFLGGTALWGTDASHMCIVDGKVGILNRNPVCPLHVAGSVNFSQSSSGSAFGFGGAFTPAAVTDSVSIKADQIIWTNRHFLAQSDERIKKNITPVTDSLDILNKLNIVSFDFIDPIYSPVKHGLIAQKVKEVYPEAVHTTTDYIPSVVRLATYEKVDNVTITSPIAHGFIVNDKIKLYINQDGNPNTRDLEYKTEVLEVLSDTQFVVKPWTNFELGQDLLIYGKEVNDFLGVDKPLIGLMAAGACKILSGQVSTLQADASNASTITGQQASTITGLEATIAAILQKYPL